MPYLGKQEEQLATMLVRKLHRYLKPNVKLIKLFNTKKASMFCPTKDKVTKEQKANVIYKIICPECNNVYVGKTDRCFGIHMNEHGTRSDQPMHQHLIARLSKKLSTLMHSQNCLMTANKLTIKLTF